VKVAWGHKNKYRLVFSGRALHKNQKRLETQYAFQAFSFGQWAVPTTRLYTSVR
jgi:hypothetical protein